MRSSTTIFTEPISQLSQTATHSHSYVLTSAKLDATRHRWLAALSTYSFKLQYRAGRHNFDADALSRCSHGETTEEGSSGREWELVHHLTKQFCKPDEAEEVSRYIQNNLPELPG